MLSLNRLCPDRLALHALSRSLVISPYGFCVIGDCLSPYMPLYSALDSLGLDRRQCLPKRLVLGFEFRRGLWDPFVLVPFSFVIAAYRNRHVPISKD